MKKAFCVSLLIVLLLSASGCANEVKEHAFFFPYGIVTAEYSGSFSFNSGTDDSTKEEVTLHITEIESFTDGKVFELKLDPTEGVPENRLLLGTFYVQGDRIYKFDCNGDTLKEIKENGTPPENSILVCQKNKLDDSLSENLVGFHQTIKVKGSKREYTSYNTSDKMGYYEDFTWEKNVGLISYRSGYGMGINAIELTFQYSIREF